MKKLVILVAAFAITLAIASFSFAAGIKKDVEFKAVGDEGKVTFSHEAHTITAKLECKECHPTLFKMQKGADVLTMKDMQAGKNCGKCHVGGEGKPFSVSDKDKCGSCHKK